MNRADEVFVRIGLCPEDPKGKDWTKIEGNMKTIRCVKSVMILTIAIFNPLVWDPLECVGLWIRMTLCGEELGQSMIHFW